MKTFQSLALGLASFGGLAQALVPGKAFDRMVVIFLENTDYDTAYGDPDLKWIADKGITLENSFAVTHPSLPNYMASWSGDYFGVDNDERTEVAANVSTLSDLLEDKGISWGHYQEDLPETGFDGMEFKNPTNGRNGYVRKHNPAQNFLANSKNPKRLANIKNQTLFYQDLFADRLPQVIFWTPNMQNDGHDTDIRTAGSFSRKFLAPLLNEKNFMQKTLVLLTFDESHQYTTQNRILGILLGDAVPKNLVGTKDSNYYNHYSQIATVEANWNLHTLGRYDVGANVYKFVAEKTGDVLRQWSGNIPFSSMFFNESYPGPFNLDTGKGAYLPPNVDLVQNGRTVLPKIKETWGKVPRSGESAYQGKLETPDGLHPGAHKAG